LTTLKEIRVPDIGDFSEVDVIEVLVAPGDMIEPEQGLITLETDKATMDVPSPLAGEVVEVLVSVGDKVSEGSLVLRLEAGERLAVAEQASARLATLSDGDEPGVSTQGAGDGGEPVDLRGMPPASPPDSGSTAAGSPIQVLVPDIGDFSEVDVIEVLVAPGDSVEKESPLVTLETDKATMDVPSPSPGNVLQVQVRVGDKVSKGSLLILLQPAAGSQVPASIVSTPAPSALLDAPPPAPSAPETSRPRPEASVDERRFALAYASPSVRRFARELGVDLIRVNGTGKKGRITHQDVKQHVKSRLAERPVTSPTALPSVPEVDFAKFGPVQARPLSRVKKISGPRLHASWVNIPHVTQHDEADITDMDVKRKELKDAAEEQGIRLTPLAFIVRACVMALREFPQFNASLDKTGEQLVYKQYMHIGFAADTEQGLVVPVIRDADKKDIFELARELSELSARAREGKLKAAEMQGGCFTISSLGGIGGTAFTPIINAPELAILGVSRSRLQPVWDGARFVPRLMLPVSLSYDHRVIDGADAARFTSFLANALGEVERLVQAIP